MALKDVIQATLSKVSEMMGNPVVTWQDEDYACVAGGAGNQLVLDPDGFERTADLTLYVSSALFTGGILPESSQTVIYQTKRYRIAKITTDAMKATVRLSLVSDTKGV